MEDLKLEQLHQPMYHSVQDALAPCDVSFFQTYQYVPCKTLGKGASSKVVLARPDDGGKMLAVKCMSKEGKYHTVLYNRLCFESEVSILSKIRHNHIVEMDKACEGPKFYSISMPYYKGGSLKSRIPLIDMKHTIKIFVQLASAVQYLHDNGVVHRDIKPGNILLTSLGDAVLSDFGLSRVVGSKPMFLSIRLGTRAYMAPEIIGDSKDSPVDWYKSDMYSLGLVLWSMLTNKECTKVHTKHFDLSRKEPTKRGTFLFILERLLVLIPEFRWSSQQLVKELSSMFPDFDCSSSSEMTEDLRLEDVEFEERFADEIKNHADPEVDVCYPAVEEIDDWQSEPGPRRNDQSPLDNRSCPATMPAASGNMPASESWL